MKTNSTNLSILITAGLVSLGVAWYGVASADTLATVAVWSGGIGLVLTLILASALRDDATKQHVIRVESGADLARELQLYAHHNGYKQYRVKGDQGLIRRSEKDQPEVVVFEFVKSVKPAPTPAFSTPMEDVPVVKSNNGFTY